MYKLLVVLMITSAFSELSLSLKDFEGCTQGQCVQKLTAARNKVLKIDWKPITMFPSEARKFR